MAVIQFEKQERWCGNCGEAVIPIHTFFNTKGVETTTTHPLCPHCHRDTRKPIGREATISPTRRVYTEQHRLMN